MDQEERLRSALADRYLIEREIGRGGMATVYLAQDLKHDRQVAVKVLDPDLAENLGAERFLREIKTAANLTHPHILPLHDSGEADGSLFYVMPYIEGESLRQRLEREKQLPVDEAIEITREVADALAYAHERGVIHRDVKPANILLEAGHAVLTDFGVAQAVAKADQSRLTGTSVALGTPAYMSPEQATGERELDWRSDQYALACVVYEMLVGEPPHTGNTVQAVFAKVMSDRPRPVRELRETAPVHVETALERALAKLPADRYGSIRQFVDALEGGQVEEPASRALRPGRWSPWVRTGAGSVVVLLILAAGFLLGRLTKASEPTGSVPTRFFIDLPTDAPVAPQDLSPLALSSDGTKLVFVGRGGGGTRLYVREMSGYEVRPIPGTEGATGPFFSPNGEWIGFFASGRLKKVRVSGGVPVDLSDAVLARGAYWGPDDVILFTSAPGTGLWRVPANGGTTEIVTGLDSAANELTHRFPYISPDGESVFFSIRTGDQTSFDVATVAVLSTETGRYRGLMDGGSQVRYLPTGHLLFARAGALHAVAYDYKKQQVTGQPFEVVDSVTTDPSTGAAHFSVSETGTLAYVRGGAWVPKRQLSRVTFGGEARPLFADQRAFRSPRFSPDGQKIAVVTEAASDDIWVFDMNSGTPARLTFENGSNVAPLWSPTGERIVFSSNRGGRYNLYVKKADGTGSSDRLTASEHLQFPDSWHPDVSLLAFTQNHPETGNDIWLLTLGDSAARPFLSTASNEYGAAFSPDGNWLAYTSDESGQDEIYIQPFPATGGKWQVSTDGGRQPAWAPNGQTLYYRSSGGFVEVVVSTEPEFSAGRARHLMDDLSVEEGTLASVRNYDVAPDGRGIVVVQTGEEPFPTRIHLILNWFEELMRPKG